MAINENLIISACAKLPLIGNEDGLIPAFGLYLTQHYADFYNYSSYETINYLEKHQPDAVAQAEEGLREAGRVCAFYTLGGIMISQEWEAVVMPMIESDEDWVYGIVAVVNTFGWGKWKVEKLIPHDFLDISITNSYESEGWLKHYPLSNHSRCYLAQGGASGIMNLLYQGNIRQHPPLNQEYYESSFNSQLSFRTEEVECRTMGNKECRFITKRGL